MTVSIWSRKQAPPKPTKCFHTRFCVLVCVSDRLVLPSPGRCGALPSWPPEPHARPALQDCGLPRTGDSVILLLIHRTPCSASFILWELPAIANERGVPYSRITLPCAAGGIAGLRSAQRGACPGRDRHYELRRRHARHLRQGSGRLDGRTRASCCCTPLCSCFRRNFHMK